LKFDAADAIDKNAHYLCISENLGTFKKNQYLLTKKTK